MIESYEEAYAILSIDPGIDPAIFWPSVGVTEQAARDLGRSLADHYDIEFPVAMALLESGATLSRLADEP